MNTPATHRQSNRLYALLFGASTHSLFAVSIITMMGALYSGMQSCRGNLSGTSAILLNIVLLLQFPLLHSLLLTSSGRAFLGHVNPRAISNLLAPTTYVFIASFQILFTFLCWTPSGNVLWQPDGIALTLHQIIYGISWLLLAKSMWDAHLGIQTGYIGWLTVWRNKSVIDWPSFPIRGLFSICRQPIYISFALTLWSGPIWTIDKIVLGIIWSAYSLIAPIAKERRYLRIYGDRFRNFQKAVPYFPGFHQKNDSLPSNNTDHI